VRGWPPELNVLHGGGWLADTPEGFRVAVLSRCLLKCYDRGEPLYHAGDPPGGLYGLITGGIAIELAPNDRAPHLGIFARPGFWIGEVSVLARRPRVIGVRSTQDSLIAHLPLAQWDAIVQSEPEAWRWLAFLILRNELLAVAVAGALMIRDSATRVAAMLLILTEGGTGAETEVTHSIEVSQDDISHLTGLSRSTIRHILDRLEADGLVERSYRRIRVVNYEGLRQRRAE
jgi:CRP/FNR family cyclic AMP-dependent transcriptional regulator